MMEVLVFVDGIDAMTSKALQARRSYEPAEMAMNEQVWGQHLSSTLVLRSSICYPES